MTGKLERDKLLTAVKQISASVAGFVCYVIASADGKIIAQGGDCAKLRLPWLFRDTFGGKEEILSLFVFLEGKISPQHTSQGDIHCMLLKPTRNIVVGIFHQGEPFSVSMYHEGNRIAADLDARMSR